MSVTGTETIDYAKINATNDRRASIVEKVWLALRGAGMGAHLDADYAKELATELRAAFDKGFQKKFFWET